MLSNLNVDTTKMYINLCGDLGYLRYIGDDYTHYIGIVMRQY